MYESKIPLKWSAETLSRKTDYSPPGHKPCDGADVVQPVESGNSGIATSVHVRQKSESAGNDDTPDWQSALCAPPENSGHLVFEGQRVEGPASGVQVRVSSAPCGGQNNRVDDGRKSGDTGVVDSDDEWRGAGVSRSVEEHGVIIVDQHGDDEDTADVEHEDTPEDPLDGLGDGLAGVLGLSKRGRDDLGTDES